MAAGLQSFQSNDKQMQAIRELVTVVERNNANANNNIDLLQQRASALESKVITFAYITRTLTEPITIEPGSYASISRTISSLTGYKLIMALPLSLMDAESAIIPTAVITASNFGTTTGILTITVYNPGTEAITINSIYALRILTPESN